MKWHRLSGTIIRHQLSRTIMSQERHRPTSRLYQGLSTRPRAKKQDVVNHSLHEGGIKKGKPTRSLRNVFDTLWSSLGPTESTPLSILASSSTAAHLEVDLHPRAPQLFDGWEDFERDADALRNPIPARK